MREHLVDQGIAGPTGPTGAASHVASHVLAFSPTPMLASWRTRNAEFAPPLADEQPTEERFMFLLRRSLSRKMENRLTERERKEIERVRAKLTPAEHSAFIDKAVQQRKELKLMPKAERQSLEAGVRLRTEMQMLELELRGSDLPALEHAVEHFERATPAARLESSQSVDLASASAAAAVATIDEQARRATKSLIRQLLQALQVERARSSRLERLLAETATQLRSGGPISPGAESFPNAGGGGVASALESLDTSFGSTSNREARGGGATDQNKWHLLDSLGPPLIPVSASSAGSDAARGGAASQEQWRRRSDTSDAGDGMGSEGTLALSGTCTQSAGLDSASFGDKPSSAKHDSLLQSSGGSSLPGFSSPLAARVHTSIESEIGALQRCTEEILSASLASSSGQMDASTSGQMASVLERSSWLARDIAALRKLTRSSSRRQQLQELGTLLGSLECYVGTLRTEIRSTKSAEHEAEYELSLQRWREIVDVPSDGDCLFHALAEAIRRRAPLVAAEGSSAAELRARVVRRLRASARQHEHELRIAAFDALSIQDEDAPTTGSSAALLREALISAHGAGMRVDELSPEQLAAAYCKGRSLSGIFGERLELLVLSEELALPLRIFYRAGADAAESNAEPQPAEVMGVHFAPAEPVELLCSLAKRHFRLLVPLNVSGPRAAAVAGEPTRSRSWLITA